MSPLVERDAEEGLSIIDECIIECALRGRSSLSFRLMQVSRVYPKERGFAPPHILHKSSRVADSLRERATALTAKFRARLVRR